MWILIQYSPFPPGQFPYVQSEGIQKKFFGDCDIHEQAKRVYSFRKGNSLPRATYDEALEDIDCATCKRLGNDPHYCYDTDVGYQTIHPPVGKRGCATCGGTT
jgi:hypothetical protein